MPESTDDHFPLHLTHKLANYKIADSSSLHLSLQMLQGINRSHGLLFEACNAPRPPI